MIVTCPGCKKNFKIDTTLIPVEGRNLQCGSCKHIWFFKLDDKNSIPLTLNENLTNNETDINIEENNIAEAVKIKQSIKSSNSEENEKKVEKILEKQKSLTTPKKKKNRDGKFFSNLIVVIISIIALIILLDTLKTPLTIIFPSLEIILFNLFETLKDIKLFIIDLF